jgi:hypothetical protein
MAAIDKAIELLEQVLEENYKLSEGYEIKPSTRDDIEQWISWYKSGGKEYDKQLSNCNKPAVINRRELLIDFSMKRNKAPKEFRPQYENEVDEYLKSINSL